MVRPLRPKPLVLVKESMKDYYIENFLFPCRVDQQLLTKIKTVKYNILPGVQQVSDETKTQIRTKLELNFFKRELKLLALLHL